MGSATDTEHPDDRADLAARAVRADRADRAADRRARIAELRAAEQRHGRRRKIVTIVVVAVLVAALAVGGTLIALNATDDRAPRSTAIPGVRTWDHLSRTHVNGTVAYPQTPPVGGDHNPVWLDCTGKVYDRPVPNENAVHSLEHGAVWVTYNARATPADLKALAERVAATPYSFMSPYPDEQGTITLSAWGTQLVLDSATDPRVEQFFTRYVQGPQTQEPGASCSPGSMPLTNG